MKKIVLIFASIAILIIALPVQAALLPQSTGSCPTKCLHYQYFDNPIVDTGMPKTCKEGSELQMQCKLGQCVFPGEEPAPGDVPCNYSLTDFLQMAVNFVNLFLSIAGSLALLMFGYGGYGMLTSVGNPEAIGTAKKRLTGGFIGLIIVLSAVVFVQFSGALLGASVSETGEVNVGIALCQNTSDDGKSCGDGDHLVCYKQQCITECDWNAKTEETYYGYSCQPVGNIAKNNEQWKCCTRKTVNGQVVDDICSIEENADEVTRLRSQNQICTFMPAAENQMYCVKDLCPDGTDYQCCISAVRKKAIEEQRK